MNRDNVNVAGSRDAVLHKPFVVGQWRVMPELNQLQDEASGKIRHLEPRLMHLLCYLAANPQQVLSRDELVQELWPRVIVNENSLTRAVSELRKQLQTAAGADQSYIQTIPKRGYRLCVLPGKPRFDASKPKSPNLIAVPLALGMRKAPSSVAMVCLSLVLSIWLTINPGTNPGMNEETFLADSLINHESLPIGGEFQLSASPQAGLSLDSMQAPVISPERDRYAYITREATGFTIYVGEISGDGGPMAVYECPSRLTNLAWSPVGNALLFAQQPNMTPAAIFSGEGPQPVLLSLDLDNLTVQHLVEEEEPVQGENAPKSSLT